MSDTNPFNSLDDITDPSLSADTEATKAPGLAGHELFERIGVGGMGEVYRCGDDALGRDLAIKVLKVELHSDADAEQRFLREARLTGSLQHPGVVPIHHLGRFADGRPCYTMKLVRGRTLADLLQHEPDGPERLPRLLAVVEKVCQAMAFAHSKGVIHRDLKPSNVMVGEFGEVQVMDWGLAKELSRAEPAALGEATEDRETVWRVEEAAGLSRAGTALGTPSYMPPEQAAGDWDIVDERADVFALGAILCEVLTGWPPYHGANREDLLRRARGGDLAEAMERLQQCEAGAALVQLVRDCLAPQREGRPRNAREVAERLAAYEAAVQERLRQAELERVAAQTRAQEEQARTVVEQERAREALARAAAERRAKRRLLVLAAVVLLFVLLGVAGLVERIQTVGAEKQRTQEALKKVTEEQEMKRLLWRHTRRALNWLTDDVLEELLDKQSEPTQNERLFLLMVLGFYVQQFAEERGEDENSLWVTAEGHFRVAKLRAFLGHGEEAEKNFRAAVRLYEKLAGDSPAKQFYRSELASSLTGLGNLLVRLGRQAEAEVVYRQALTLQEKLAGDSPALPELRVHLAGSYVDFGNLLRDRGQPQAALDRYGKAISLLQAVLAQDAQFPTARRFLRDAHWNRALALGQLRRHAESAKDWHRATELDIGRMQPYFRLQHALALAHIGEHRVAVKAVEELLSSSSQGADAPSGPLLYDAACVYSLSAAAVKDDAPLREQYAVRAVALLRQAQKTEFFKDPSQIENMRKDPDLDALGQRKDFKKLLAEFK